MNEEISVDELPLHSPWPQRILGLEEFQRKPRNSEENHREYETEKWKNALDEYLSHAERPDFTKFIRNELSKEKNHPVYWQKKLLIMRPEDSFGLQVELIAQAVEKYLPAPALVELGAGTGRVLFSLAKKFQSKAGQLIGAEFSENGRNLMKEIGLASKLNIKVLPCDFTQDQVVQNIPEGAIMFTCMSAVCIPHLKKQFVKSLIALRPKIVIHFEPVYQHCRMNSLLGLMQRQYIKINYYNKNLMQILKKAETDDKIKILREDPALLGTNPFLAASILEWIPNIKYVII